MFLEIDYWRPMSSRCILAQLMWIFKFLSFASLLIVIIIKGRTAAYMTTFARNTSDCHDNDKRCQGQYSILHVMELWRELVLFMLSFLSWNNWKESKEHKGHTRNSGRGRGHSPFFVAAGIFINFTHKKVNDNGVHPPKLKWSMKSYRHITLPPGNKDLQEDSKKSLFSFLFLRID